MGTTALYVRKWEDDDARVRVGWGWLIMGSWGERLLMHTSLPIIRGPCDLWGCGCVLSQWEWRLFDEAQRCLYHDVMLETFVLVASLSKALIPVPSSWAGL